MNLIQHRSIYYTAFGIVFFIFWFLFKVGGLPEIPMALLSTAIDIFTAMFALVITVELLLPHLAYKNKYRLFFCCYLVLIFISGSAIILSQLALHNSSLADYRQKMQQFNKHYFYWFWADLIFGSYFLVFFISSAGAATRFAFD